MRLATCLADRPLKLRRRLHAKGPERTGKDPVSAHPHHPLVGNDMHSHVYHRLLRFSTITNTHIRYSVGMRQQIFGFCTVELCSADQIWSSARLYNNCRFIAFLCVCCFVMHSNVLHAGENWEIKSKGSMRLGLDQEVLDVSSFTFKGRSRTNPQVSEELISFGGGWIYFGDITETGYSYFEKLEKSLKEIVGSMYKNESMEILRTGKSKNQIGALEYVFYRPSISEKTWSCVTMRQYFDCFGDMCGEGSWSSTTIGTALGTSIIRGNYCKSGSREKISLQVAERFFDSIYVRPKWTTGLRGKYPQTAHVKKEPTTTTVAPSTSNATDQSSLELEFWQTIKESDDPDMYREYLRLFPEGVFSGLAKLKIKKLGGAF